MTEVKCLACLRIENTKKTAGTQYVSMLLEFSTNLFLMLLCDMEGNMIKKTDVKTL